MAEEPPRADLLVLFATASEEKALRRAARVLDRTFKKVRCEFGEYYPLGSFGDTRVVAVRSDMGPHGARGSSATALFSVIETGATSIATVGMCFGVNPEWQAYRDVVVSTALVPYDRRNVHATEGGYRIDYSPAVWCHANPALIETLRRAQVSSAAFEVHFGALLSGGARIHASRYRDELVASVPAGADPIVGGEMEGVGLLTASPADAPNWIIVKGISDFGDDEGGLQVKQHREAACQNAVDYLFSALSAPVGGP